MSIIWIRTMTAGIALFFAAVHPVVAGDEAVSDVSPSVFLPMIDGAENARPALDGVLADGDALSSSDTDRVVRILQSGQAFCASLADEAYAIDCLAERMETAANAMPTTGEYADARAALLNGAARLSALARANADSELPRATARQPGSGGLRTSRPLVPVQQARLSEVVAQAEQIIAETETVLLRSAESSSARKVHYTRIAAAVGSNKVLLRSI